MSKLIIGSKVQVYNGKAEHTSGGLYKKDIIRVTDGNGVTRYKSKEQHANGKKKTKKSQKARHKWTQATKKAYKYLKEKRKGDSKYPATVVSEKVAKHYHDNFVSMKKSPLTKKSPTPSERLYIVIKLYYEGQI